MTTSAPHAAFVPDDAVSDARDWRMALVVTAVAGVIRLAFAALLPLFPDETYYWEWSRHHAAGYFDHPPAIARLIASGTDLAALFGIGPTPFAIRLVPVLAGIFACWCAARIARRIGGGRAALITATVFAVMPLAATGLVLATPDAPLLATTALGLLCVVMAVQSPPESKAARGNWIAAGVALGLAFTSKYTSILLPMSVTVAVLLRPGLRAHLRKPGPWLACAFATLVFLPVLLWNRDHDWISFRFQLQHGLGTPKGSAIKRELDLIGGQLGLVSPIIFALAAHAVWRSLRKVQDDARFLLAVVAVGSWVFFVYSAMRRSVEANWPAPSYLPGVALMAALASSRARDRWLRAGIGLSAVMSAVIYLHALHPFLPLPARRDPVARAAGWDGFARRVQQVRDSIGPRTAIGSDRYQETSELSYHVAGRPQAYCSCVAGRRNQYELWPTFPAIAMLGDNFVLALDEGTAEPETITKLAPYFTSATRGPVAPLLRGADTVSVRRIWILSGYRGGWPARVER